MEPIQEILLTADEADTELQRLRLAFKRLAEFYLEFGAGQPHVREMAIRGIWEASLEALQDMVVPKFGEPA